MSCCQKVSADEPVGVYIMSSSSPPVPLYQRVHHTSQLPCLTDRLLQKQQAFESSDEIAHFEVLWMHSRKSGSWMPAAPQQPNCRARERCIWKVDAVC